MGYNVNGRGLVFEKLVGAFDTENGGFVYARVQDDFYVDRGEVEANVGPVAPVAGEGRGYVAKVTELG